MSFKIFPDILKKIESLPEKEQEEIKSLFASLGPSYSSQKELIEYILDIRGRDGVLVEKIIDEEIKGILNNHTLPREKKLIAIKIHLRRRRFPLLSKAEELFISKVNSLNLPSDCKLIYPLYWEKNKYELKFNFTNIIEASEKLEQLLKISQTRTWQELINEEWFDTLFS